MNSFRLVLAIGCLAASAPALADNCLPSSMPMPEIRVAAPEMASAPAPAVLCVTAAQIVARARASLPQTVIAPAAATPVPASAPSASQPANWANSPASRSAVNGYVPKTEHDNTPWRFDMSQNGKRMTADEFDAWMKAKGIHVATGKPAAVTTAAEAASDAAASIGATGAGEKAEAE